ncbi:MAG: MFS transporter, partial [Solirubrobacterales bacterium]|nr:MFS transporter [Solirubrobacterales bacterium]
MRIRAWTLAAAAMLCCGWGGNQFTPLLALYRSHNHFSEVIVDALLAAYVLGLVPALLIGGSRSDRHGRKRLMQLGLISCIAGSLCLSLDVLWALALGRLLSGVGIGLAMAVGTTWVVELSR